MIGVLTCSYHHLKLYPEEESGPQSTKKPVVVESYDEVVFPDSSEAFFGCVQNHAAIEHGTINEREKGDTQDHVLSQWFMNISEADELLKLAASRQQVQAHIIKLRRQLSVMDGMHQLPKPASAYE